jgi:hypothetical protein
MNWRARLVSAAAFLLPLGMACGGSSAVSPADAGMESGMDSGIDGSAYGSGDATRDVSSSQGSDGGEASTPGDDGEAALEGATDSQPPSDASEDAPPTQISCDAPNTCSTAASPEMSWIYGNVTGVPDTQTWAKGDGAEWISLEIKQDQPYQGTMTVGIQLTSPPTQYFRFDAYLSPGNYDASPDTPCAEPPTRSLPRSDEPGAEQVVFRWPYVFGTYFNRTIAVHVFPAPVDTPDGGDTDSSGDASSQCWTGSTWTLVLGQ